MSTFAAILWKDLVTEWRSRDRVVAMLVFSLLVVIVYHFALPDGTRSSSATIGVPGLPGLPSGGGLEANAPGLLWVAYLFASILGLNRAFALELENEALSGLALAPVDRGWLFLGKACASFALICIAEAVTAVAFALVFDLDLIPVALPLAAIVALGTAGVCSAGTLFAAMTVRTRFREVLLPILLLPALFPVLSGAVRGTAAALAGEGVVFDALQLLIVVDGIYLVTGFLLFEFVLDE